MLEAPRKATNEEVPVLDLSTWLAGGPVGKLPKVLKDACMKTGFFYVTGHGVSRELVDGIFDATRRYYDMPEEVRLRTKIDEKYHRGFMPQGIVQHQGFDPDLKESFHFGVDLAMDDPDVVADLPLHGPNRWPAEAPWLRPAAEAYFAGTTKVGRDLLRLFALALDQDEGFFLQWADKPMNQVRLLHYPAQKLDVTKAMGVAPHTDYGLLTVLAQDPIGGLEILNRDGEWLAAPYIEDSFVVNIGDLFQLWTNDMFISTLHRVVNRTGRERFSIPTFINPNYDTPVSCLPNCQSAENPPKHADRKAGDHLVRRYTSVQKYKAPTK